MRQSRFSEEQMVVILREDDATSVAAAPKKHNVSEQTIYAWCKQFGEIAPSDTKRLRTLQAENLRLKRLLAYRRVVAVRRSEETKFTPGTNWKRPQSPRRAAPPDNACG